MKYTFFPLLFLLFFTSSIAQTAGLVPTVTEFIKQRDFDAANKYLDSIIKTDSKNIDALMMKGNVILNRNLLAQPEPQVYTANDESIYIQGFEVNAERKKTVDAKTESEVEALWLKSLALDSNRLDIRKGLAVLYAMAINKEKLKKAIAGIKKAEPDNGEQAFNMCEYARKIEERGRFDDAMEIYKYIAGLYPAVAGVRADMASEYYYEGRLNDALTWLDSTFNFKTVDETSFLNAAYLYSELGYFDNAQDVLNTYSKVYDRKMGNFYFGLRQFADSSDNYYNTLKYFTEVVDSNAYYTEYVLAMQLLNYRTSFTLANYQAVINMQLPDAYKVLLHSRAVKQFADCDPYVRYGVQQSMARNFSASVQLLEEGANCNMQPEEIEYWKLNYGYALFMHGNYQEAIEAFKRVRASKDAFAVDASKYFTGMALSKQNKIKEARLYFQDLADSRTGTKYTTLGRYRLEQTK